MRHAIRPPGGLVGGARMSVSMAATSCVRGSRRPAQHSASCCRRCGAATSSHPGTRPVGAGHHCGHSAVTFPPGFATVHRYVRVRRGFRVIGERPVESYRESYTVDGGVRPSDGAPLTRHELGHTIWQTSTPPARGMFMTIWKRRTELDRQAEFDRGTALEHGGSEPGAPSPKKRPRCV